MSKRSVTANFSSFYILLILNTERLECFETLNVLNYMRFPITDVDEDGARGSSRKEMGFQKSDNYPLLVIDSSSKLMPPADLVD